MVLASSDGYQNTYGLHAGVRILLECCLVDFELSKIIEHPLS